MEPDEVAQTLLKSNFSFITGVPDSVFRDLLVSIVNSKDFTHVISNNEGEAIAFGAGYHIATGKVPVVYLQNSGLGNAVNPLTSLLDAYIYSIPTLLLIAWRGAPGEKDEPQHKRMGEVLAKMVEILGIPYRIATKEVKDLETILAAANDHFETNKSPFAILFPRTTITNPGTVHVPIAENGMNREEALKKIVGWADPQTVFVTTTGKTSRELFEIREGLKQSHEQDFLTVGSMGCSSIIGAGIALYTPNKRVVIIDGDGACLMRMESLAFIGHYCPKNYLHIVMDNQAYESTGSQKTLSDTVDFVAVAKACRYPQAVAISTYEELMTELNRFTEGPKLIVARVYGEARENLGRPTTTPVENKKALMHFITKE